MGKLKHFLLIFLLLMVFSSLSYADSVNLYVDTAPNVYGSPDYPAWEEAAFAAAADGSFVNMANGINPENIGTTDFEIQDEVVYSFGDKGKRLYWIYYIAGETIDSLSNKNLQVSLINIWDGDVDDFYYSYYGSTWITPTILIEQDVDGDGQTDGVIGRSGMAWWGAYDVNTQDALDADIAEWGKAEEDWIFTVSLDGAEYSITSHRDAAPVPEPATMLLFGSGLAGLAGLRRKFKKA